MKTSPLLLVSVVALPLFAPMMVGCGGDAESGPDAGEQPVTRRLPCAAVDHDFMNGVDLASYRFTYDENGNETFYEKKDSLGVVLLTVTREFEGNQATRIDTVETPLSSLWTATLEDGHPVSVTNLDRNGGFNSYTETWVWDGQDLLSRRRDYDNGITPYSFESFAAASGGFVATVCPNGSGEQCEVSTYKGAEFVGDFDHWTEVTHDWAGLGTDVRRMTRTFDANALVVDYESKVIAGEVPNQLLATAHHEREADGTELWYQRTDYTYFPEGNEESTVRIDYTFECPAP